MKRVMICCLCTFVCIWCLFPSEVWAQNAKIDSLEAILKKLDARQKEDTSTSGALMEIVRALANTNAPKIMLYARRGLALSQRFNEPIRQAHFLNGIGISFILQEKSDSGMYYYEKALTLREQYKDSTNMIGSYINIGGTYSNRGQFDKSIQYNQRAYLIATKLGNKARMAQSSDNIGIAFDRKSVYDSALTYYLRALRLEEEVNNQERIARELNNIGNVYSVVGSHEQALSYFRKSIAIIEKIGNKRMAVRLYDNIGSVYGNLNQVDSSLLYANKGLTLAKELRNKREISYLNNTIGNILFKKQGQDSSALSYLLQSLQLQEEFGDTWAILGTISDIAALHQKFGRPKQAIEYAERAVRLSDSVKTKLEKANAYETLVNSYESLGNYAKANEYVKLRMILRDSVLNEKNGKTIAELQTKYDTERKDKEISLLNRDKEIQELTTRNQRSEILRQRILADQQKQDILLLNSEKQISSLQLTQRESDLNKERLVNQQKEQSLQLLTQEKALTEAQVQRQTLIRNALLGLVALLAVIAALVINRFRLKRRADAEIRRKNEEIAALERTQALERERRRISQDIHDEVGSGLTKILMLSQNAADTTQPNKEISNTAQGVIDGMQEIIWSINPKNDTLQSLVAFIRSYGREFVGAAGMTFVVDTPQGLDATPLRTDVRRNIFLAVKEALNNAVKYSAATEIRIGLEIQPSVYIFTIADNGKGFVPDVERVPTVRGGNGLENMRLRMEENGGSFRVESAPNEGTKIVLNIPR